MSLELGFCPHCRRTLREEAEFCAHCGWRNPELVAKGKRLRLKGLGLMFAACLSCGGSCYSMDGGPLPYWAWHLLIGLAFGSGLVGFTKWLKGASFYAGK
jgi:hypothetical protein